VLVALVVFVVVMVVDHYDFQTPSHFMLSHQALFILCFIIPIYFPAADPYTKNFQ